MRIKSVLSLLLALLLMASAAMASTLEPLPMDDLSYGPAPKDENYLSATEYADESITVRIYEGRYADTDYVYAHIKISHPSQLRTMPASIYKDMKSGSVVRNKNWNFKGSATGRGRYIANAANAVIAINGDYYTKSDKCQVVLRQSTQLRNMAKGDMDLLIVDKNGNFSAMKNAKKADYAAYYEANKDNLYQVFCFGPVLVENGVSVIADDYVNRAIGAQNCAQRSALCQLGELEYMLVTSLGNQTKGNKGMTIPEFAKVCEMAGKELSENGCILAFNMDGGNSSTMVFKRLNENNRLLYAKVNCPEIERFLSDIVYFATLVK